MINHRLYYLAKDEQLPKIEIDVESINTEASNYARSGISKDDLLDVFVSVRKELVRLINSIPNESFETPFPGKESMTISEYFVTIIEHDMKHKDEIEFYIKSNRLTLE